MAAPALTRLVAGATASRRAAVHGTAIAAAGSGGDGGGGRGWLVVVLLVSPVAVLVGLVVLIIVLLAGRQSQCGNGAAIAPSARALVDIPGSYLRLYQQAGREYRLGPAGWSYLAGVGSIETDHGRLSAPGVRAGENFAGAGGPMQFLRSTWAAYGVDGNRDGRADRYDPHDAIPGAARYLRASGAPQSWDRALFAYNHADWYVRDVVRRAAQYRKANSAGAEPAAVAGEGVLVEGDSLAVGTRPALAAVSSGLSTRAAVGRTSRQGLEDLRSLDQLPSVLVISLGTNDADPAQFAANVAAINALPGVELVIWINIARPPLAGATDAELNRVLERAVDNRLLVVDWHAAVAADPALLAPDRIHATAAGYETRARLITRALAGAPVAAAGCGAVPVSSRIGERIGQLARAQLGRGPSIPGFSPPSVGYAWCAWFATNVWAKAGVPIPINAWSGYPYTWAQSKGLLFKRVGAPPRGVTPPVGSVLMYGSDPRAHSEHINLVDRVLPDGTFMVTGGNQDGSRVTRYGPCRLQRADPAYLHGPGCDGRPIYGIAMPTRPKTAA